MSFLVPLYLAGLTAAALPFVLHLVRRAPRGRQDFSSLMFLSPTPPRITRRSRLENLLLLALRITSLVLLAAAFARPFLREAAALSFDSLGGRRLAILLDASASMRRADLWTKALAAVSRELDDLGEHDDVALYLFDDRLRTIVEFQTEDSPALSNKRQVVRSQLAPLQPGWAGTDLGSALTTVASDLDAATDVSGSALEPQIIVVSDFQKGARLERLQSYEWPARVSVVLRSVQVEKSSNAHVRVLPDEDEGGDVAAVRIRVVNAADSTADQFQIGWKNEAGIEARGADAAVYVPPGQSRVVKLPRPEGNTRFSQVVLRGDDHPFDNVFHVVPFHKQRIRVLYVGADTENSSDGPLHFLKLAVGTDSFREVEVLPVSPGALSITSENAPDLVVVTSPLSGEALGALEDYVAGGGNLLVVPIDDSAVGVLTKFFDDVEIAAPPASPARDYLLLGEIDFSHPLFVPFRGPRYNDFTRIHFWKHRSVRQKLPAQSRVLARFDDGSPALLERQQNGGRLLALLSGWHPEESQLALSSKFVPLIGQVLELAAGAELAPEGISIHDPIVVAEGTARGPVLVQTPSHKQVRISPPDNRFTETIEPGLYEVSGADPSRGNAPWQFAVNLPAEESDTPPFDLAQLEQRGVRVKQQKTRAERIEQVRQQRDTELENRQKVWRWMIGAALVVLILETWRAGWTERRQIRNAEVAT